MKPTYEELEKELDLTKKELILIKEELAGTKENVKKTQDLLKIALEKIISLEEKLNKNSKNSSKPPSSDQKGNTPFPDKKGRKGLKGKTRQLFPRERINRHVECTQSNCPHCGSSSLKQNERYEVLQQVELPEVKAIVTEYLRRKYQCAGCGKNSTACLPEGIPDSAFGPKLMGLFATLTGLYHMAKREAILLIKDLYDVNIGVGSSSNIEERVSQALDPIYQRIHHFVMESKLCKHFDETGWRDSGKRHYVWLGSCSEAAFYMIDRTRSLEAFQRLTGKDPNSLSAVTDRYPVYNRIGQRQFCLAHLSRDFQKYAERDGPDQQIGHTLVKELGLACHIHGQYREGIITWIQRNRRLGHCKRRVEILLEDGMANGSEDFFKLCETLLDRFDKMWTFMKVSGMEPTNNMAERDMRKLVIWRKKSYGTRSPRGKAFVERFTTVAQTLRRQGENVLTFVQEAISSFYRGSDAPLISESLGF